MVLTSWSFVVCRVPSSLGVFLSILGMDGEVKCQVVVMRGSKKPAINAAGNRKDG